MNPDFQVRVQYDEDDSEDVYNFATYAEALQKYHQLPTEIEESCHIELIEVHEQFHHEPEVSEE